ncbi:MAG: hypothetical protein OXF47_05110 [Nitrospira sp.]|nr:hypothetical protein [Nitrospira sp.]
MPKKLFAIVLNEPNDGVAERITTAYSKRFKYTDTCYLVAFDEAIITEDIAEEVGLKGEDRIEDASGVVFKLNSAYSGYTKKTLWEWLNSIEEE